MLGGVFEGKCIDMTTAAARDQDACRQRTHARPGDKREESGTRRSRYKKKRRVRGFKALRNSWRKRSSSRAGDGRAWRSEPSRGHRRSDPSAAPNTRRARGAGSPPPGRSGAGTRRQPVDCDADVRPAGPQATDHEDSRRGRSPRGRPVSHERREDHSSTRSRTAARASCASSSVTFRRKSATVSSTRCGVAEAAGEVPDADWTLGWTELICYPGFRPPRPS
jgi:hypothetical protein